MNALYGGKGMLHVLGVPLAGHLLILFLLIVCCIFSAFSSALVSLNLSELEDASEKQEEKLKLLQELADKPSLCLRAYRLITILYLLLAGCIWIPCFGQALEKEFQAPQAGIPVMVLVFLISALCILVSARVGTFESRHTALKYVRFVDMILTLLYPLLIGFGTLEKMTAVPFGVEYAREEEKVTQEEIISLVDEAHEQGVLQPREAEMIQNIFSFQDRQAHDIMTNRRKIRAFEREEHLGDIVEVMTREGISRCPVYENELDNICGVIHYKDAVRYLRERPNTRDQSLKDLTGILRKATLIPETRNIMDLFSAMKARKIQMVLVVDEYGQISGLVSMEDILEEIVGEIEDEYDRSVQDFTGQRGRMRINGMASLEDVEEELGITLPVEKFRTLSGYLTSKLGHIPAKTDLDRVIVTDGYRFSILAVGNRTITSVLAQKDLQAKEAEKPQETGKTVEKS